MTKNSFVAEVTLRWPYEFYEGKNLYLSMQSLCRQNKDFTEFTLLKLDFPQNIISCHMAILPITGNYWKIPQWTKMFLKCEI